MGWAVAVWLGDCIFWSEVAPALGARGEGFMQRQIKMASAFRYLALAGALLGASVASAAGPSKLSAELVSVPKGKTVNVIVQYRTLTAHYLRRRNAWPGSAQHRRACR